jgi:hypothetical protein
MNRRVADWYFIVRRFEINWRSISRLRPRPELPVARESLYWMGLGLPSNTVPQISMSSSARGSTAWGSASRMLKSAFLPGRIEPISSARPRLRAAS